jgi:hypothetical protein
LCLQINMIDTFMHQYCTDGWDGFPTYNRPYSIFNFVTWVILFMYWWLI